MSRWIYDFAELSARSHDMILHLNDRIEASFTHKELHFLVMGALALILYWVVNFVFKRLARLGAGYISAIYTFTFMAAFALAIEIGQQLTGTGDMELGDITAGLWGVALFLAVWGLISCLIRRIRRK